MLTKGYKYIARLTRDVDTYICNAPVGRGLTMHNRAKRLERGSSEAIHAARIARALGYNVYKRRGVWYESGEEIGYYESL